MTNLEWLQNWYASQCNGLWEHSWGVTIDTIDNPGWTVKINLRETPYQALQMEEVKQQTSEDDWMFCLIREQEFQGAGGSKNLDGMLSVFRALIEAQK